MAKINYHKMTREHLPYRMKWLNDPAVNAFLGHQVRSGTDEKFHQEWFDRYEADDTKDIFMIEYNGQMVGQVGLIDINMRDKNASLYILIGEKDYQGKGFGSDAMNFILDYGFDKLGLHKISLEVHDRNTRAIKLYEKFGFKQEGRFKDNVLYDDGYGDEIRMAKLNSKISHNIPKTSY